MILVGSLYGVFMVLVVVVIVFDCVVVIVGVELFMMCYVEMDLKGVDIVV